jgi:hypothetical protein
MTPDREAGGATAAVADGGPNARLAVGSFSDRRSVALTVGGPADGRCPDGPRTVTLRPHPPGPTGGCNDRDEGRTAVRGYGPRRSLPRSRRDPDADRTAQKP